MAGGLLNLIAIGNANIFLTGNPTKTFFRTSYSKYTNFGLQRFRIDFDGARDLRLTEPSTFTFKMPRYAELLMDTYLTVTLPDIWSPLYPPTSDTGNKWAPYEFRWIQNIGFQIIKEIHITCGSFTLAKYSGEYLGAMVDRDFTSDKKNLFHQMSGNVPEINNPANAQGRINNYPTAYNDEDAIIRAGTGTEPSIRGRNIYIPLNAWFTLNSKCAFPMISLQYNELSISVTLRPIQELFQVRDVFDYNNQYPYIQPDFNQARFQMYRFLQTPPGIDVSTDNKDSYPNKINTWNADIHLLSTYAFLSKEEAKLFAIEDQMYLVKEVFEYRIDNVTGTKKVELKSNGMVANWMWFFQRNDVNLRNEWSNYTNWPYHKIPDDIIPPPQDLPANWVSTLPNVPYGPLLNPDRRNTGIYTTGPYSAQNHKEIMETMGIVLDGKYRENTLTNGVFNYIEKYTRTNGFAREGIYCYQFCLDTNPLHNQPSGAMNLGKFKNVELEFTTYVPSIDLSGSNFSVVCNQAGEAIGVAKQNWRLYDYNYNLTIFEERYNVISFIGGNCGMLYAR
jgi:hypothetical protein